MLRQTKARGTLNNYCTVQNSLYKIQDHPHDRKAIHEDHAKITISGEEASIKAEKDKSMNIGKKSTERKDSKDKEI
jgi:hypothetical protein